MPTALLSLDDDARLLEAREATPLALRAAAPALAAWYADPHNAAMMGAGAILSADEVVTYYAQAARDGARLFLLHVDGLLVGDADLREFAAGAAHFAVMLGPRELQGRGLGTRFGAMLHAFAFLTLGLARVRLSIVPANVAGRRSYEKLGYAVDTSPEARDAADEPDDVCMTLSRGAFLGLHGDLARRVRVTVAP